LITSVLALIGLLFVELHSILFFGPLANLSTTAKC
jgi:hypothetical protein